MRRLSAWPFAPIFTGRDGKNPQRKMSGFLRDDTSYEKPHREADSLSPLMINLMSLRCKCHPPRRGPGSFICHIIDFSLLYCATNLQHDRVRLSSAYRRNAY